MNITDKKKEFFKKFGYKGGGSKAVEELCADFANKEWAWIESLIKDVEKEKEETKIKEIKYFLERLKFMVKSKKERELIIDFIEVMWEFKSNLVKDNV